jgi:hypothetical protein
LFALQPLEPSDGWLALRKLMADGSNGLDPCFNPRWYWLTLGCHRSRTGELSPRLPEGLIVGVQNPQFVQFSFLMQLGSFQEIHTCSHGHYTSFWHKITYHELGSLAIHQPLAISLRNADQPSDGSNGCSANNLFL